MVVEIHNSNEKSEETAKRHFPARMNWPKRHYSHATDNLTATNMKQLKMYYTIGGAPLFLQSGISSALNLRFNLSVTLKYKTGKQVDCVCKSVY
jgi:hypothetical protein